MVRHECGYEEDLLCKRCGSSLSYDNRSGLSCPSCGRMVTLVCHQCGRKW